MTIFEICISVIVTLIAVMTFIDKLSNRQKEKKDVKCNEHSIKLDEALRQIDNIKATKADALEISNIKSDVSSLKADMSNMKADMSNVKADTSSIKSDVSSLKADSSNTKDGVNRIENLLMERTL